MRKLLAFAFALAIVPHVAHARGGGADDDDDEESADDEGDDEEPDDEEPDDEDAKPEKKSNKDNKDNEQKEDFTKQDLSGHDLAGSRKSNLFEKDRFFVDKVDTKKTAKGTLIQGSLTSTSFAYRETGGTIQGTGATAPAASQFSRMFTDLRLQTDFRHIGGGNWDARADLRGRYVTTPGINSRGFIPGTEKSSQSGFLGENELEIRELWLFRGGKRTDLTFGRQFVADLGGIKFDGLRFDYASSEKFTLLGFGGLYPIRGSRSITTDYTALKGTPDPTTGVRADAGKFTGSGGFGAAYRTQNSYGAFGGVALVPLSSESPRVFGTATGYWRANSKLDLYHYAVIDLLGSNTVNTGLTNLSAGLNFKPDQRLRATLSFNRVDTETLNVQAQAFLNDPDPAFSNVLQNEAFLIRVAQNAARASLSAALGPLQRFEITVASALRYRDDITLTPPGMMATALTLPGGKSIEVYGAVTDRHSFEKLRIGLDGSHIFKSGGTSYQRTTSDQYRASASRELANGHGEWEAEIAYAKAKDDGVAAVCADILSCYGSSTSSTLSIGGNVFYRFNRDWLGIANLFLTHQSITSMGAADPPITGLSGFLRIAYRF